MEAEVLTKSDNTIQLKKKDVVKFKILDEDGKETGEWLEFDLGDIELPIRLQDMVEKDKLNRANLKNKFIIIDKKQDHKGKKLMSSNEEEKIKAINEFFKQEVEVYNMFLGENGVQKLLYGRKLSWTTLDEINDIINDVIAPKLDLSLTNMTKRIKEKYSSAFEKKEENTLE